MLSLAKTNQIILMITETENKILAIITAIADQMGSVREQLTHVENCLNTLEIQIGELKANVDRTNTRLELYNDRLEAYQKGSDKLVNLAGSLIAGVVLAMVKG